MFSDGGTRGRANRARVASSSGVLERVIQGVADLPAELLEAVVELRGGAEAGVDHGLALRLRLLERVQEADQRLRVAVQGGQLGDDPAAEVGHAGVEGAGLVAAGGAVGDAGGDGVGFEQREGEGQAAGAGGRERLEPLVEPAEVGLRLLAGLLGGPGGRLARGRSRPP